MLKEIFYLGNRFFLKKILKVKKKNNKIIVPKLVLMVIDQPMTILEFLLFY